jgi:predicted ATP-dependent endonuclease of OLD family
MKLNRVKIKNFRSIEDLEIELNPACRVLVGINESGKSNILQALALLGDKLPTRDDVRDPLLDEPQVTEASVDFIFEFINNEVDDIVKIISSKILSKNKSLPIMKKGKQKFNLKEFCANNREGLYCVDVIKQSKNAGHWALDDDYSVLTDWKKPTETCPKDFTIDLKGSEKITVANFSIIYKPNYLDIPEEYLTDIVVEDLSNLLGAEIIKAVNDKLPKCLFWVYDEKYLLPASLKIDEFSANPDVCVPLKNMFVLAGITDIQTAINNAKQSSRNSLTNFLKSVANKTTTHFRDVWKEYKTVEFELKPDGENIIPAIKEENSFDFAKRSDGFKRFVSFLLMISANVKTDLLKNTLLLIDEPDLSLHPSGARYLRNELIKISKKNYVVYSTHSIFMIDGENIDRHIIVKKKNEKTSIATANDSNIIDEEVIYNALGYSIFETLKAKNIIFEGWKDKNLFKTAISKLPDKYKDLKNKFKDIGTCHAKGVKHIKSMTPLMELAQRKCFIVSDSDTPAKEKQTEYQKINGYGIWKRYDEIISGTKAITAEDFIKIETIKNLLKQVNSKYPQLPIFEDSKFDDSRGILFVISEWLKTNGFSSDESKKIIDDFKNKIFQNLKPSDILDKYYDFVSELEKQINLN